MITPYGTNAPPPVPEVQHNTTVENPLPGNPNRHRLDLPPGSETGLPVQPQTTPRGGGPKYFLPSESLYPTQISDITDWKSYDTNQKEAYKQLIPTSTNLRNRSLQDIIARYNQPLENQYAGQGIQQAANQRAGQIEQSLASAAARGMSGSGALDKAMRGIDLNYMSNVANATSSAQDQERARKQQLLSQIFQVPENDQRFYEAIRSGTVPASNLFGDNTGEAFLQTGQGAQTLVKTLVSMGVGGAAMSGGFGGGAGGGFSAGDGGMSSIGGGTSAFGGGGISGASWGGNMPTGYSSGGFGFGSNNFSNAGNTISFLNNSSDPYQRRY